MSAHTTIPVPRLTRRRLYVVAAVAIAVVAAAILLAIGIGGNRDQPASSPTAQDQRYANAISQLTPEELSAAFGTNNPDLRALMPTSSFAGTHSTTGRER